MHQEPDVGFDPGSPGSRPGPKAGAKPLRHPGIPIWKFLNAVFPMMHQAFYGFTLVYKNHCRGSLGGAAVWRLPLAQGAILETQDRIPRRAPGAWSLLLPQPMSLPLFLSLCDYHK